MKKPIVNGIVLISLVAFIALGGIGWLLDVSLWILDIHYAPSTIPYVFEILCKILAGLISFSIVGFVANLLGFFDSKIMSAAYIFISIIVTAALTELIRLILDYVVLIGVCFYLILIIILWTYGLLIRTHKLPDKHNFIIRFRKKKKSL